jgi:hypothetical protein
VSEGLGFELVASSLRAETGDIKAFVEALATKLEGALPAHTQVERKGGLFSKAKSVRRIVVDLGEYQYQLDAENGRVQPRLCKVVRGIVLKTEAVPLDRWIDELSRQLTEEAQQSEQGRLALENLLGL